MSLGSDQSILTADVAVVGGGIVGRAVALELARQGFKIALIDGAVPERMPASQAAGAMLGAFGEVTAQDQPPGADVELTARVRAADGYGAWLESLAHYGHAPVLQRGTVIFAGAASRQDRKNLVTIKAALEFHARRYESVDTDDVPYINPASDRPIGEAIYLPDENSVIIPELMASLGRELESHPQVTILREEARRLLGPADHIAGVATSSATISAKWTVLAAGVHTTGLVSTHQAATAFVPPLLEGKGTSIVLEIAEELPTVVRTPNREFACGLHLVPRGKSAVYLGATNRASSVLGATGKATAGEVHYLLDSAIHEMNTRLANADVISVTAGSRPISPDRRPLFGVTALPGLAVATGTYRNGVLLAPYAAGVVAGEIASGFRNPENHFTPVGRIEQIAAAAIKDARQVLQVASGDLLSMFIEPGGSLPYGREHDFIKLFQLLISLINNSQDPMIQELCNSTVDKFPIDEIVPELLIVLLSRPLREHRDLDSAYRE
jgi:glycine oxidase